MAVDLGTAQGAKLAIAKYPELDILVNNLGIFEAKPFEDISAARFHPRSMGLRCAPMAE